MELALGILCLGLLTYAMRAAFLAPHGRAVLAPRVERVLRYVPPAVLVALIVPDLVTQDGALAISLTNPRLLAGAVALLVALTTRRVAPTLLLGMGTLWLLTFLLGQ